MTTFKYFQGNFDDALVLVQESLHQENAIPSSGSEPRNPCSPSQQFVVGEVLNDVGVVTFLNMHSALEVVFLPSEFYVTLDRIKYEIMRVTRYFILRPAVNVSHPFHDQIHATYSLQIAWVCENIGYSRQSNEKWLLLTLSVTVYCLQVKLKGQWLFLWNLLYSDDSLIRAPIIRKSR